MGTVQNKGSSAVKHNAALSVSKHKQPSAVKYARRAAAATAGQATFPQQQIKN